MEIYIKLVDLSKIFHTKKQDIVAVKDINITVGKGDFVSLLGPSGCGKSTIIRMINDIIKPSDGKIFIDGDDITQYKRIPLEVARKMGFIFQHPNLYPWLTLRQNILLPLKILKLKGSEWESNADKLMEVMGLNVYADAFPTEVSGGSLQRAGVVRAMVHKPEILLMDEPFGALDENTRTQMNLELLDIWKKTGKTILFITHSVKEAILLSNRVYVLGTNPGRVIDEVTIDLPRPRTEKMMQSKIFKQYEKQLSDRIGKLDLSKIK